MNAIRCRILSLLIVIGLVVPTMQVAGHSCWGDSCPLHLRQAAQPSGARIDSCCNEPRPSSARPCQPSDAGQAQDDGCCSDGGCDCICCGAPVVTAMDRSTPTQVTIALRSGPVAICRSALRPQDAVGALLQPPQF